MMETNKAFTPPALKLSMSTIVVLAAIILAAGVFLRVWPSTGFHHLGYDEGIYRGYVQSAVKAGLWNYPDLMRAYIELQRERPDAIVPATRIGFLLPASALSAGLNLDPLLALRSLSAGAAILLLFATPLIGYRLGNIERALLLSALIAVAPLQIHLAQRSLIDGYFAFWAVLCAWFLWENLQSPNHRGWLTAYGSALFVLVLTKENAAFVFAALMATLLIFAAFKLGRGSAALFLVSLGAPLLAILTLATLVGGIGEWISFYQMFVRKSAASPYPATYQDGTWYRYLVDFTLLSPLVVVLALGRLFQIDKQARADLFWATFLGASYLAMSLVLYGKSLRFAAYWDLPLRWLAVSQLLNWLPRFRRFNFTFSLGLAVSILVLVDLLQYWRYFVQAGIYDPVSFQLLHASRFVK